MRRSVPSLGLALLQRGVHAGVLDGDGRLVGEHRQDLELPRLGPPSVHGQVDAQDADPLPRRRGERGEERVERVPGQRVVRVVVRVVRGHPAEDVVGRRDLGGVVDEPQSAEVLGVLEQPLPLLAAVGCAEQRRAHLVVTGHRDDLEARRPARRLTTATRKPATSTTPSATASSVVARSRLACTRLVTACNARIAVRSAPCAEGLTCLWTTVSCRLRRPPLCRPDG